MTLKQKPTFKTTLDLSKIIKKHNIFSSKLREKTEFFCRMGGAPNDTDWSTTFSFDAFSYYPIG